MRQPLVLRPPYGGGPSLVAVSQLPQGGPLDKGLPLDSGIPGYNTFAKPVDDIRQPSTDDEPIRRIDDANDLTKDRNRIDTREDNADKHDGIGTMGKGEWAGDVKTLYPYRDGIPNAHYASARFVAELWCLQTAPERLLVPSIRVATTLEGIVLDLSAKVKERARKCRVTLTRADIKNLRWLFSVDSGHGPKVVKMKATRPKANIKSLDKMDIRFTCSCPAWRWSGAEYHADGDDYQLGPFAGTASVPHIRDPKRVNRVCKHVAAVIDMVRAWKI